MNLEVKKPKWIFGCRNIASVTEIMKTDAVFKWGFGLISRCNDSLRFWYSDEFQDWVLTAFILFAGL